MNAGRLLLGAAAAGAVMTAALSAQAGVVSESLPYYGSPDWTTIIFYPATSMVAGATTSTLTTAPGAGVWFGYGTDYGGGNIPSWTPGSPSAGNLVDMDLSFSEDAKDWSAYLLDGSYQALINFNPSDCNCYDNAPRLGVDLYFDGGATFVPLDVTARHEYEFLLKGGEVSYRIDGVAYSGDAQAVGYHDLLVIGDGSGSTPSGLGAMTVYGVSIDNAPEADVLTTTAPEPGAWALLLAGIGLLGGALRRRRTLAPA